MEDRIKVNDSILWESFKLGNEQAFDQIYKKYFSELFNYGLKFRYDKEFIKDSIQELFEELWIKRQNLGTTDNIRYYFFISLKRKILKKLKYQKPRISIDDLNEQYTFDADFTIEDSMIYKELEKENRDRLQLALDQLSNRQKEVIYLRFYSQLDIEEVSKLMDLKIQSVRNLLFESISKLRTLLYICFLLVIYILS